MTTILNLLHQKTQKKNFSPSAMVTDYGLESKTNKPLTVIRVNQKVKKLKNDSSKTSRSNIHQLRNNNKKVDMKRKKNLNISVRNNNNRNKRSKNTLNSNSTIHKDYSTIDYSVKSNRYFSPSNKNVNVSEMMERFEKLKEFLSKKEEEEINKNNPLLNKKSKGKKNSKLNSRDASSKTLNKNKKAKINNAINKLYAWDEKRKENK